MVGVVARYERGEVPYLLPVSVDGLILVLSVSLFDVANQIRERLDAADPAAAAADASTTGIVFERLLEPATSPASAAITGTAASNATAAGRGPTRTYPDGDEAQDQVASRDEGHHGEVQGEDGNSADEVTADAHLSLAPDLVPLLPAARAARDELLDEGATVSRDALAQRLRRHGTAIRNNRVSELLAALKGEPGPVNELRHKTPV